LVLSEALNFVVATWLAEFPYPIIPRHVRLEKANPEMPEDMTYING
jgi:hypothetical protein